jgi:thioredoxin reductase (NADPH)
MTNFDTLILGAGPAGLSAAIYASRAGAKTAVLEPLMAGGQINLTPDIENYPGFTKIGGAELGAKMLEHAETSGAQIIYDEIQSVDLAAKKVTCAEKTYAAKSIIIATGASPRKLGLPNEEEFIGAGIHFCALCDGAFYRGKNVLVVGGGNHAVEEAIYLSQIAKSVTMCTNTEKLTAQKTLIDALPKPVLVHFCEQITAVSGGKTGILVSFLVQKQALFDGIFVAIGRVPNTNLFKNQLKMTPEGYIITDKNMATSTQNVFAAGDIVDKQIRQVITAAADGAIAGTNAGKVKCG